MRVSSAIVACAAAALSGYASADVSMCLGKDKKLTPCGPGNQVCPPGPFGKDTPQFHVKDDSCGENDPNGPSYDPVHGVYHLHYQNHVGLHGGRTYGHAVSKDMTKWAHMPDSIWNDQSYDASAIYTGSATIVNGTVIQVYPGLCNPKDKGCPGGTNLCIAVAADAADPLATNWSKGTYAVNPIVNATGRDPSTAWQTPDGEWRLTTFDTQIMASMDFKTWYRIGAQKDFPGGECPSFFPLPPTTPGAGPAPAGAGVPTHVHKASHGGKDWMQVGSYTPGKPKVLGKWATTPGVARVDKCIDTGALYASKDFWDPVKKRRINWGWARVPPSSTQTLPREVTWHPELQQLVFSPVEEQDALRATPALANMSGAAVSGSKSLGLPSGAGKQVEVRASFAVPTTNTSFGIGIFGTSEAFVDFVPGSGKGSWTVAVGVRTKKGKGGGSGDGVGIVRGGPTNGLALLPSDKTIDITVYYDQTFAEIFWQGGRVALTAVVGASDADYTVFADSATTADVAAWAVSDIWVSPEEVKNTERLDAQH